MMNNKFIEVMAMQFAKRLAAEGDPVGALFERGLGRKAEGEERELFEGYLEEHGLENACRIFFNLNEFVYVD